MTTKSVAARRIVLVLFILYVLAILFLLVIPNGYRRQNVLVGGLTWEMWASYVGNNINLVPLRGLIRQLANIFAGENAARELVYLIGNAVGFIPLGFFLPALFAGQRRFPAYLLAVLLAIAALELLQVMSMRGSCDVDDLILNTAGACAGYWMTRKYTRRQQA